MLGNEFATLPFDEAHGAPRRGRRVDPRVLQPPSTTGSARDDPGDDLLGWLSTTEVEGERLTREDILDILGLLMIAGLDTVAASLACMLSYFARHPDAARAVVADPSLWPSAVEELMRFESPVTEGGRIATEDLELPSGEHIPAGTQMSRDLGRGQPRSRRTSPTRSRSTSSRAPNPHIGFASGFHRCLGSHLARMEMQVALEAWHQRIPDYEIEPGATSCTAATRARRTLPARVVLIGSMEIGLVIPHTGRPRRLHTCVRTASPPRKPASTLSGRWTTW